MKNRIKIVLPVLIWLFSLASPADAVDRMLLTFRSEGSMMGAGLYGPAGITVNTEGYVYLVPGQQGRFTGSGTITISMKYTTPQQDTVSITPLKGEGSFDVEAVQEGTFLKFYFKSREIPCKGDIIVNYPAPMGQQKKPFETNFDPAVLAVGREPGVKIEMKDGAQTSTPIDVPSTAKGMQSVHQRVDFWLNDIEMWRVVVEGEELDTTESPIRNSKLKTSPKELPIAMRYKWKLVGEFSVIGKGSGREYYDGDIFSGNIDPVLEFKHEDLYQVTRLPGKDQWDVDDLIGVSIGGKVSGVSVRLKWPEFTVPEPYLCTPNKSYLGKVPYRPRFESMEMMGYLSKENLTLVDGTVINGGASDWLKYTITLKKIK
ncbi:MAG: hypothetical protein MUP70_12880 [Candidatus Aminicenantes bacterium]|nr:hypothetical protein [Candidatus Aminicenantes bacterium]